MTNPKERPLVKRRIEALLKKTTQNGCTPGEALSALEKAKELVEKYGFAAMEFTWPKPPKAPKPKREVLGVGKLARNLILEHRDWSYAEIADEVNQRLGSKATARSVAWYASKMNKAGEDVSRIKPKKEAAG